MISSWQCWLCDGPAASWREKLVPVETFPVGPRYGSYLRCVPVQNRIGDYVHCTGRVVNIILKRLMQHFPDPGQSGPIKEIINKLTLEAQGIPIPERLAPRHTKVGSLDLTASTLFVQNVEVHGRIGACLRLLRQTIPFGNGRLNLGAAIELLFRTLHGLHTFWRQKTPLTPSDRKSYLLLTTRFGELWFATGWKVSTWVHWVVRHSSALVELHHSIYLFSSIPTERRNVEFKLDVTHCYKGWKLSQLSLLLSVHFDHNCWWLFYSPFWSQLLMVHIFKIIFKLCFV